MPVPNLDLLSPEKLLEFADRHQYGRQYKLLFPAPSRFVVNDTAWLSCFADVKACEKILMSLGDAPQALVFKGLSAGYYSKLSPAAQWRKK